MTAPATRDRSRSAIGLVALAVVCFSLGSTLVKKVGSPGGVVAFWRLALGSLIWLAILQLQRRRPTWDDLRRVGPPGVLFGLNLAFFFMAVTRTNIANVEFIGSLTPVVVVPVAAAMFHEHLPARALGWGAVAIAGVGVVVFGAARDAGGSWVGDLLAVASVALWAGYLLLSKRARASVGTTEFMATAAFVATAVLAPLAIIRGGLFDVRPGGWIYLVALALVTGTAGHGLVVWAQRHVPVSTISVLTLAQPALATLWAFLFVGESVGAVQIGGMAVVLGALTMFTMTVQRA